MGRSVYPAPELRTGDRVKFIPSTGGEYSEVIDVVPVEGTGGETWCLASLDEDGKYRVRFVKRDLLFSVKRPAHRKKKPADSKVFRLESVKINQEGHYDYAIVRSGSFEAPKIPDYDNPSGESEVNPKEDDSHSVK